MKNSFFKSLIGFLFWGCLISESHAATIIVTGSWVLNINPPANAGNDFIDTHESLTNQIVIDIDTKGNVNWRVDVSKQDGNWPTQFHLHVQRTSNGFGAGSIANGTTYQEITSLNQSFFSGSKKRTTINVQLKLTGVSLQVDPDTYTTTVYYTVTEI